MKVEGMLASKAAIQVSGGRGEKRRGRKSRFLV
jgi:hypothetical protein